MRHNSLLPDTFLLIVDRCRMAWDFVRTPTQIRAMRRYSQELFPDGSGIAGRPAKISLGIIESYSFLSYMRLGYDWLGPYYNPNLYFDEVHYFQTGVTFVRKCDVGYPLYLHRYQNVDDVEAVCRAREISVLRAYNSDCGKLAYQVSDRLSIPVVVSVH